MSFGYYIDNIDNSFGCRFLLPHQSNVQTFFEIVYVCAYVRAYVRVSTCTYVCTHYILSVIAVHTVTVKQITAY